MMVRRFCNAQSLMYVKKAQPHGHKNERVFDVKYCCYFAIDLARDKGNWERILRAIAKRGGSTVTTRSAEAWTTEALAKVATIPALRFV